MKTIVPRLLGLLLIMVTIASCTYRYALPYVEERYLYRNNITSVAVLPFINATPAQEGNAAGEIFASELARFREVSIVHPAAIEHYLQENNITVTPGNIMAVARSVGAFFKVETVIVGTVTEANVFFPPVLGVSINLVDTATGDVMVSKSSVYDSSFNYVREEVKRYASVKRLNDSLYKENLILQQFDSYVRFVCYEMVKLYL